MQQESTSRLINIVAVVTNIFLTVTGVIGGVLIAVSLTPPKDHADLVFAIFLGLLLGALGALAGSLFALPITVLLKGFAKIVAWYEATPPGYVCIMQPSNVASSSPQPISNRSESTIPGGHAFRSRSLPVSSGSIKWWECKCGTMNSSDHMTCTSCGHANPQTDSSASAAPSAFTGCWTCSCGAQNPASQADCDACGASNPRIVR